MVKNSFKVYCTNDNRILVESPFPGEGQEVQSNGLSFSGIPSLASSEILEIKDTGLTVGSSADLFPTSSSAVVKTVQVVGILGLIHLTHASYLIVIKSKEAVCKLQFHSIHKIIETEFISLKTVQNEDELSAEELGNLATDNDLIAKLKEVLQSKRLYFSTTYDLTHSLQHNTALKSQDLKASAVIDNRYHFNSNLSMPFLKTSTGSKKTEAWIFKVIAGFVGAIEIDSKGKESSSYYALLIARINTTRLATRYHLRGLDLNGHSANTVEMEQIILHHDHLKNPVLSSFVQTRGSVPVVWRQVVDLSYRPRMVVEEGGWESTKQNLEDLAGQYRKEGDSGPVVCVNLLDDVGFEAPLTERYEEVIKKFGDARVVYEGFSINKWCKKMQYQNMAILLDRLRSPLAKAGWFVGDGDVPALNSVETEIDVVRTQTGVVRVSCLDSLDRTNLTCSLVARHMLPYQIQAISVFPVLDGPADDLDPVADVRAGLETSMGVLTNLWADAGDAISMMYAGTGALKADVTRTGKRDMVRGSYTDGVNALTRYYLNNFTHGQLQDCYDILTGACTKQELVELARRDGGRKAERRRRPLLVREVVPGCLVPTAIMNLVEPIYFSLREKGGDVGGRVVETLKEVAPVRITNIVELWFAMVVFFWILVVSWLMKIKGRMVVDLPRLRPVAA